MNRSPYVVMGMWLLMSCGPNGPAAGPKQALTTAEPRPESVMVRVPGGPFTMGTDIEPNEQPRHGVDVTGFEMDRTEVTAGAYEACVRAGACPPAGTGEFCNTGRSDRSDHPINCVGQKQAETFCTWVGKRLPSEEEWEYAALGADGRKYPWGNEPPANERLCWNRGDGTCTVGGFARGAGPFGLLDMAGNVWEWTASGYSDNYIAKRTSAWFVNRGGSWKDADPSKVRGAYRGGDDPSNMHPGIGFRCARPEKGSKKPGSTAATSSSRRGMVSIPGGTIEVSTRDFRQPWRQVSVEPFQIDATEVTASAFRACVLAGACEASNATSELNTQSLNSFCNDGGNPDKADHPMNCVNWHDATKYCTWAGKRLPTEAEWRLAARGADGRTYPWGNDEPGAQLCWNRLVSKGGTCPVGSYARGASPFGVLDLAGNVWEWTSSRAPTSRESDDPSRANAPAERINLGGSWADSLPSAMSSSNHSWDNSRVRTAILGFRCASSEQAVGAGNGPASESVPSAPTQGVEMIHVPGGSFEMGANDGYPDERPKHTVAVDAFEMDKTEVTVAAYGNCVKARACVARTSVLARGNERNADCNGGDPARAGHPINCVDWTDADKYCKWAGKRLPTEEEWEFAARGSDGRTYPWGKEDPAAQLCWKRREFREGTCAVGSFPLGASPYGVLDMAGNVCEWTSSRYSGDYDSRRDTDGFVHRGGNWDDSRSSLVRASNRNWESAEVRSTGLGFRCARTVSAEKASTATTSTANTSTANKGTIK